MPGDPRGAAAEQHARNRVAGRLYARARRARACEVGQRRGDDRAQSESVVGRGGHAAVVHRAGEPLGKRILRIVQWETARRVFEWGDFLFAQRGAGGDRAVAEVLQCGASTQRVGISAARTGKLDGGMKRVLPESPFACRMVSKAGCGRGQGSAMNSLRSALTAVLAGLTHSKMQAKGDTESRRSASDILTIKLVQNTGLVNPRSSTALPLT